MGAMIKLMDAWRRGKRVRVRIESEKGQAIVILALAIVGLLGFTALAIDGGNAYYIKRNMQNAADAAVVAALQSYLDDVADKTSATSEQSLILAAHATSEINMVEDSDATSANCVNDNVYTWYIDADGFVLDRSTGTQILVSGNPVTPVIGDTYDIGNGRTACSDYGSVPTAMWDAAGDEFGVYVITSSEFDTFLAGVIGRDTLAAQGAAAAVIDFDKNGCGGDYAVFGLDTSNPSGTINISGSASAADDGYEVDGGLYAADDLQITYNGNVYIDGTLTYSGTLSVSTATTVWLGPIEQAKQDSPSHSTGSCPSGWTFWNTGISGEVCIYTGYTAPALITPALTQPFALDVNKFAPGGMYANDAAGCDTSSGGGCTTSTVSVGGLSWTKYGNNYYYNNGSATPSWSITAPIGSPLPTGIYYLANKGVTVGTQVYFDEYLTIVTGSTTQSITATGAGATSTVSGQPWKPYGGTEGSGISMYANTSSGTAIHLSGADLQAEGIFYAPNGDCLFSGSTALSGVQLCNQVNFSGSAGAMSFNPAYCEPPHPSIRFTQ